MTETELYAGYRLRTLDEVHAIMRSGARDLCQNCRIFYQCTGYNDPRCKRQKLPGRSQGLCFGWVPRDTAYNDEPI